MDGQVRLGQDDRARGATLLGAVRAVELDEVVPKDREPSAFARRDAELAQFCR
jgi:hypothetical protein